MIHRGVASWKAKGHALPLNKDTFRTKKFHTLTSKGRDKVKLKFDKKVGSSKFDNV